MTTLQNTNINDRELEFYLEKEILVLLKDGRQLWGTLKSYDQYYCLTLNFTTERIFHEDMFSEKRQGLVVIRGENIVLIGKTQFDSKNLRKVDYEYLCSLKEKYLENEIKETMRCKIETGLDY